ncbi:MAG: DUF1569 domain-containing protein [Phycisphaeraceae bacterium]|nr:DUF1569 domain-containing protein [Phycisphaeraceae bacterium]
MPTANHRLLALRTLDGVVAEAERLARADAAGTLKAHGNWTLGQTLGHLAAWMEYPYDGYPDGVDPPWLIRTICRLFKRQFLGKPMKPGYRLPGAPQGTYGTDPMSTQAGLERLRSAAERMASTPPSVPNPIFGPMAHEEWIAMNVGHANLHLGFFEG